jgi:hypothetical protein
MPAVYLQARNAPKRSRKPADCEALPTNCGLRRRRGRHLVQGPSCEENDLRQPPTRDRLRAAFLSEQCLTVVRNVQPLMSRVSKPKAWSESEKRQLALFVRKGSSAQEISAALNRRAGSIKKMAQEMKLVVRKKAKKTAS